MGPVRTDNTQTSVEEKGWLGKSQKVKHFELITWTQCTEESLFS